MKILITGGLGYIGYFTVKELLKNKRNDITIIDDFSNNQNIKYFKNFNVKIFKSDYGSKNILNKIFKKKIDFVIHLASYKKVQESIIKPKKYYKNNVVKTKKFLDICKKNNVKKIIFASSASIYGKQNNIKVKENFPSNPLSPYARNKVDIENYLKKLAKKKSIQFIILRYFNIAGGENKQNSIELIKINNFIHKAIKLTKNKRLVPIYGKNYDTKDGTTLRDYVYIKDVAKINVKILSNFNRLKNNIFNVGSGKPNTLMDVLKSIKTKKIKIKYFERKTGDIEAIVADNYKINKHLKIKKYSTIKKIVSSL